jgi:hypothetical protein
MRKAFLYTVTVITIAFEPALVTADAQNTAPSRNWRTPRPLGVQRSPVVIAVAETFPYRNADVVIVRRPKAPVRDLILVKKGSVDGRQLARAVRMLEGLRAYSGVTPVNELTVRVPSTGAVGPYEDQGQNWAEYLRNVRPSRLQPLPGLGEVPYLRLMLADNGVHATPQAKGAVKR